VPGAGHLEDGAEAAAYVRPHDVRVSSEDTGVRGTIERVATLGWLARLSIWLPGGETLVAHVPNEELGAVQEGDEIWLDLRSPKAFGLETGMQAPDVALDAIIDHRTPDVVGT
jgi:ABC-type sulfate/molybdate transport systems ATPase subunit